MSEYYRSQAYAELAQVLENAGENIVRINKMLNQPTKADGIS